MRTTKPISTVSFNSPAYLALKLEELRKAKKIEWWAFIVHSAESDEAKDHIHLYLVPAKMLQTEDLREFLQEYDASHPDKPLGCLPFQGSKFSDWCLYSLHDEAYLSSKGQSRQFHYSLDDFITSDADFLEQQFKAIDTYALDPYRAMKDAIEHGVSWAQFFARGTIPIQLLRQYKEAWQTLADVCDVPQRAGRSTHTPKPERDKVAQRSANPKGCGTELVPDDDGGFSF